MLELKDIENLNPLFDLPKKPCNENVVADICLVDNLMGRTDLRKYDFDIYLPAYGCNLQRPYVWELPQQQEFIMSLLLGKPVDKFVFVQHEEKDGTTTNLVIDGKQRLLTIKKFFADEFPVVCDGKEYYHRDFSKEADNYLQRSLNWLTATIYYSCWFDEYTEADLIKLFNYYNFTGTPQTAEHKAHLQSLLAGEEDKNVNKEKTQ